MCAIRKGVIGRASPRDILLFGSTSVLVGDTTCRMGKIRPDQKRNMFKVYADTI